MVAQNGQNGTCVSYYDVHTDQWIRTGDALPDARAAWRQAVAAVAERARAALPECNGRVESAVKLVLAGDVALLEDGTAQVGSQSDGATVYHVNGQCECPDFPRAPHGGQCKHKIARAIALRAHELLRKEAQALDGQAEAPVEATEPPAAAPAAPAGLPEAPASANVYVEIGGRKVQVTLRDIDEDRLLGRLARLMARYPVAASPAEAREAARPAEEWCRIHEVWMDWQHNDTGRWLSHRVEGGTWCKGKAPKLGRAGQ